MIIALDIDDTISANPVFFSFLSRAAADAGHTILIITYRENREIATDDLNEWGITWHKLITATMDDLNTHGFNSWKAHICREHEVDVFFEDMIEVLEHVDDSVTKCLVGALVR